MLRGRFVTFSLLRTVDLASTCFRPFPHQPYFFCYTVQPCHGVFSFDHLRSLIARNLFVVDVESSSEAVNSEL